MHAATLVLGSACFLSFVWGALAHFRRPGAIPPWMHAISLLSLFGFLWFVSREINVIASHGNRPLWAGVAAMLSFTLGLAVFWWAVAATRNRRLTLAFTPDRPAFLHTSGPYAYVRHPFYSVLPNILDWHGTGRR